MPARSGGLTELFAPGPWRYRAILGLGLATVGLATYWGIFAWGPELVSSVLGSGTTAEAVRLRRVKLIC